MNRATARTRRAISLGRRARRRVIVRLQPIGKRLVSLRDTVPAPVRAPMSKALLRRPWTSSVPIDSLLLGSQAGLSGADFAIATRDLLWPSTRVVDGPHTALLERAVAEQPNCLTDDEILDSSYAALARDCIRVRKHFFGATDDAGILRLARSTIARHLGAEPAGGPPIAATDPGGSILVARVRGSSTHQVLDGHHRVASMAVKGAHTAPVTVKWLPVQTPLQELLSRMSWIGGTRELYQPVDAPELERWTLVRKCTDRLAKMRTVLAAERLVPSAEDSLSYLDVASCYGWFVKQMELLGFAASGMERDPLALQVGEATYDLSPDRVEIGDCVELLRATQNRFDVVSCFSLLHHFVLGRGSIGPEELVRLLDTVTGRILFLDTGQEHEEWFMESLPGWSTEYITVFLKQYTSFDRILDLGPDEDAVGPYAANYRRHLFACVR